MPARDPRLSRPPPGPVAGGRPLAWLLAAAVLLAGSWGALHRVAHDPLAPHAVPPPAATAAAHDAHAHHAPAPRAHPSSRLQSAVDSHESASDTCRLLDQLACADGLLVAAPVVVPVPPAPAGAARIPAGTAQAPAGAYRARAPPAQHVAHA